MNFRHERIDSKPPAGRMTNCHVTDLTGNGKPDIIVTALGANPRVTLPFLGELQLRYTSGVMKLIPYFETNIFWYENPGWKRHTLAAEHDPAIGVGSTLFDVDDDGRLDLIVGQGAGNNDVYWYEQPEDPRQPWIQHRITDQFQKYHDFAVGDVDNDGEPEVIGLSQQSETLFYFDIPEDPTVTPWPEDHLHIIDDAFLAEGLNVADLDGDGRNELVAGTRVYRHNGNGSWEHENVVLDWDYTRVAVADLDGDEELEIVFTEGDSPALGTHPARLAWFDAPDWKPTIIRDDLYCPHSLQVADFDGDGLPDIFVGEMGLFGNEEPKSMIYRNLGNGEFEEHVISRGIPTHEAKVVDVDGDGRPDIVGKSYEPTKHVDVWYNEG